MFNDAVVYYFCWNRSRTNYMCWYDRQPDSEKHIKFVRTYQRLNHINHTQLATHQTLGKENFAALRTAHHRFLLWIIGFQHRQRTDHLMSYAKALKKAQCESVQTTIRKRRLLFAGAVQRTHNERLNPSGDVWDDGWWRESGTRPTRK